MTANLTIETFPNEAAADYIRGKAVADPKNFGNLPDQLKQRAFTVAGIEQLDVLRRMRDIIAKLPEGASWDEAKRELAAEISPFIDVDDDSKRTTASRARAEFLLRTHGFQAYAVARHQQQMEVVRDFPYWKYETVGDSRVRPGHAALDGKVLRADDPWWNTHYPPWDWGCRCIVIALDEDDAEELGITDSEEMPMPERSGSFTFDPTNVAIDMDALQKGYDEPDWKLFTAKCRQETVQANGREPETMWELMLDGKMQKTAKTLTASTERDGRERALVLDFDTGKKIAEATGEANSVKPEIPDGRTVCTLHTHPDGDNMPSPADIKFGWETGSKAEYIAAGTQLRRWQWLKTPTPEDADLLKAFALAIEAGDFNRYAYDAFIARLVREGFIKMEKLS
jgi:SPP1 gp7 family putative phage head morphogenesis protein